MATPSPSPYSSSKYDVSTGADGFHNLPGRTDNDFEPTSSSYWIDIAIVAGMPYVLMIIGFAIYWNFLCCRSGCYAWLCNSFCCCKGLLAKLLCCCNICKFKDCCCPDIRPETAATPACCCFCTKHATGRCHNGCFAKRDDTDRKWKQPRAAAFIIFLTCFALNIGVIVGKAHLQKSFEHLGGALKDLGDVFHDMKGYCDDLDDDGTLMYQYASGLYGVCVTPTMQSYATNLMTYADAIEAAGSSMATIISGLPAKLHNAGNNVENFGERWLQYTRAGAFLLLGVIYGSLGMVASLMFEGRWKCCRVSTNLLACTSVIGIITMFMLSTAVAVELLVGQVIGDFCYAGPGVSATDLAGDVLNNTFFTDITTFYTSCSGTNPFQSSYDSAISAFGSAASTITASSSYLQYDSGTGCNDNSGGYYSNYESLTTALGNDDDANPLYNIYNSIGCSVLNPIFSKVLDEALCESFIDGFYTLFGVHTTVIVFTYIAMFLVSFLRWDLQRPEAHNEVAAGNKIVDAENVANPVGEAFSVDNPAANPGGKGSMGDVEDPNIEMRESSAANEWEAAYDENSGQYYYHNVNTGETTWEKPESLMNEAEKKEAAIAKAAQEEGRSDY